MIFFIVSFIASIIGVICGIGGGVIIKPVFDMLQLETVSTISFLSGCTVLSMSSYNLVKSICKKEHVIETKKTLPLAVGAVLGGIAGKQIFTIIKSASDNPDRIGMIQALCLGIITLGTLVYILNRKRIHTLNIESRIASVLIGLMLGIMSSFLGIGGGPINLVVLYFFFSMDTKTTAANSLYIIFFSQLASLLTTVITGTVPQFRPVDLIVMIVGGIGGGILGRRINCTLSNKAVDRLLIILMAVIICICIYNGRNYLAG